MQKESVLLSSAPLLNTQKVGKVLREEIVCNFIDLWYTVQQRAKMPMRRVQSEIKN